MSAQDLPSTLQVWRLGEPRKKWPTLSSIRSLPACPWTQTLEVQALRTSRRGGSGWVTASGWSGRRSPAGSAMRRNQAMRVSRECGPCLRVLTNPIQSFRHRYSQGLRRGSMSGLRVSAHASEERTRNYCSRQRFHRRGMRMRSSCRTCQFHAAIFGRVKWYLMMLILTVMLNKRHEKTSFDFLLSFSI